jgi:hypothetical protein
LWCSNCIITPCKKNSLTTNKAKRLGNFQRIVVAVNIRQSCLFSWFSRSSDHSNNEQIVQAFLLKVHKRENLLAPILFS